MITEQVQQWAMYKLDYNDTQLMMNTYRVKKTELIICIKET